MAVVPIDSAQKAMVLEPYENRVSTVWTSKVMNELTTRGLLDSEEQREQDSAEGRKVLDFLLVSNDGDACDKFCQSISTNDCGESLAGQLQESECRSFGGKQFRPFIWGSYACVLQLWL